MALVPLYAKGRGVFRTIGMVAAVNGRQNKAVHATEEKL